MYFGNIRMKTGGIIYRLVTLGLQAALVLALFSAGWLVYQKLPPGVANTTAANPGEATIQLIVRPAPELAGLALDITVELYPVDIVAVRHEYFIERRAGKRFDDFLNERMNGRTPITARLDQQGKALVVVSPGPWWIHAVLAGDEDLEWRLPINVSAPGQTIELTPQNAYARTKSF
jgi:hypothetical protein